MKNAGMYEFHSNIRCANEMCKIHIDKLNSTANANDECETHKYSSESKLVSFTRT